MVDDPTITTIVQAAVQGGLEDLIQNILPQLVPQVNPNATAANPNNPAVVFTRCPTAQQLHQADLSDWIAAQNEVDRNDTTGSAALPTQFSIRSPDITVRANLAYLPDYMREDAKDDITHFNNYVKEQMEMFSTRGELSNEIVDHVFAGYLECKDHNFHNFVCHAQCQWDLGEVDYTWETLLSNGERVYQMAKMRGTWRKLSIEQEEIIALKAEIHKKKNVSHNKVSNKALRETKKRARKPVFTGKNAWRMTRGTGPMTKTIDDHPWKWCTHHAYWGSHYASECRQKKE